MSSQTILKSGPEGKDTVIVASREALSAPSSVVLPEPQAAPGLILPDGSINWGCPCLGGMATGPCGTQFRDAFSCFHYSEADPKGSDCYEKFSVMQDCMARYPELYGKDDDDDLAAALESSANDPAPPSTPSTPAPPPPPSHPAHPADASPAAAASSSH
ncbi:mitochondrial intermembrane space import and assembly protein 40-B-like [Achroia grisella]|uniref:mitochondrial intermembrane space import and assembly protein 40-B-like n=1 Tax=Achroia grisella TaxID=688607 RepID=UPI0027D3023C|nr:mitochondrial intermembrane space import and assembly protein 40-B-like [Achroia grisella]